MSAQLKKVFNRGPALNTIGWFLTGSQYASLYEREKPTRTGVYWTRSAYGDEYERVWCQPWKSWFSPIHFISAISWKLLKTEEVKNKSLLREVDFIERCL